MTKFVFYGMLGLSLESLWTGFCSLLKKDYSLRSTTSLWMFFIYGLAVFLEPIARLLKEYPLILRGGIYVAIIFAVEYLTGTFLKNMRVCPWDYSASPFSIKGVIRLDYAPVWFFCGLLFEQMSKLSLRL